jgi:uncharacterized protein GlcG (DUF336 family)
MAEPDSEIRHMSFALLEKPMRSRHLVIVAAALALVGSLWIGSSQFAFAQDAKPDISAHGKGKPIATHDISAEQSHAILAAAMKKAEETGTKMDIAVVDAGGNLKAFIRMDGAWLGSIDIAIKKAKTARYFDMPTGDLGKASQPGGPLYNIEVSNGGLITFPGGIPLKDADGTIIGAIGVSGSTVENDHVVAEAGVAAIK